MNTHCSNAIVFVPQLFLLHAGHRHHGPALTLVQGIVCRLFGTRPLPEATVTFCQLDTWEQNSMKFESNCHKFY